MNGRALDSVSFSFFSVKISFWKNDTGKKYSPRRDEIAVASFGAKKLPRLYLALLSFPFFASQRAFDRFKRCFITVFNARYIRTDIDGWYNREPANMYRRSFNFQAMQLSSKNNIYRRILNHGRHRTFRINAPVPLLPLPPSLPGENISTV